MNRSALHLSLTPPLRLRSATLKKICERGALRIGYVPAHPWVYRTAHGLRGHDADAAAHLARALQVEPWFVECGASDLPEHLASGDVQVCVGGLVVCAREEVSSVRARHVVQDDASPARRTPLYFPNVWWVSRGDLLWRLRLAAFLLANRTRSRPLPTPAAAWP